MDNLVVKLSGQVRIEPDLPYEFSNINVGDLVISHGWPHIVIDAGEQGKRIAGFKEPYSIRIVK